MIAYGSRTLTAAEKNFHLHASKLEFLALKWAISEKFRDYLYYAPTFTVFSDNNPLTYVLSTAKLNATTSRWVTELADFHFTIKYKPGSVNGDADALSRMPLDVEAFMKECSEELSSDAIKATIQSVCTLEESKMDWSVALAIVASVEDMSTIESVTPIPTEQLKKAEQSDPAVRKVLNHKVVKPPAHVLKTHSSKTKCLFRE